MSGVVFAQRAPLAPRSPNRADVALFVGAVRRRPGRIDPLSPGARLGDPLYRWLESEGWTQARHRRDGRPLDELLDVPVPIESWRDFDRLFDWASRPLQATDEPTAVTYLGSAVRAFF